MNIDFELHLSPFSTRRICSRDAKRKQEFSNVIGWRKSSLLRQPITLPDSCFRFASREQIRLVENGLYARLVTLAPGLSPFSTRRICSRDAKRKQEFSNVIGWRKSSLLRQPITLPDSCFRFALREQIRLVESGLYARNGASRRWLGDQEPNDVCQSILRA